MRIAVGRRSYRPDVIKHAGDFCTGDHMGAPLRTKGNRGMDAGLSNVGSNPRRVTECA